MMLGRKHRDTDGMPIFTVSDPATILVFKIGKETGAAGWECPLKRLLQPSVAS
jgi:NAD/NADP transhydrogenase beta subunit